MPAPHQELNPPPTAASHAQPVHAQQVSQQNKPAELLPVADQQAASELPMPSSQPLPEAKPVVPPVALLPRPIIPDFELNPGMEAVEEEFSSSEEDEDDD